MDRNLTFPVIFVREKSNLDIALWKAHSSSVTVINLKLMTINILCETLLYQMFRHLAGKVR
jgi:mRNA deadenylase 3'-5' endonuclease subunit Ccr4